MGGIFNGTFPALVRFSNPCKIIVLIFKIVFPGNSPVFFCIIMEMIMMSATEMILSAIGMVLINTEMICRSYK